MQFRGECYVPGPLGQASYEHMHRYAVCLSHVNHRAVLDVACGKGYGSHLLSAAASTVVGVDIDESAIQCARLTYCDKPGLIFEQADYGNLPFADGNFDVVVTLRTIEYIEQLDQFLAEAHRVLRKDGLLIISMPNNAVYSEARNFSNKPDAEEFSANEFKRKLEVHFANITLLGQRLYLSSLVGCQAEIEASIDDKSSIYESFLIDSHGSIENRVVSVQHPQYFLAFCSNTPVPCSVAVPSVCVDLMDNLWPEKENILRSVSGFHEEHGKLRTRHEELGEEREKLSRDLQGDREQTSFLVGALQPSRSLISLLDEEAAGARASQEALLREVEVLRHRQNQLQASPDIERDERDRALKDADEAQRQLSEQSRVLQLAQERASKAEASLEASRARLRDTESKLEQVKHHLEGEFASVSEMLRRAQAEVLDRREMVETLRSTIQNLSDTLEGSSLEIAELETKNRLFEQRFSIMAWKDEAQTQLLAAARAARKTSSDAHNTGWIKTNDLPRRIPTPRSYPLSDFALRSLAAQLETVNLFDQEWYCATYADVPAHEHPFSHFLRLGLSEDRDPHPLFSSAWYRLNIPASELGDSPPIIHFLNVKTGWRIPPHPLFDSLFYIKNRRDEWETHINPLAHYLQWGASQGRAPHPLFDPIIYRRSLKKNEHYIKNNPLLEYAVTSKTFAANPHPLFDGKWYLQTNPDVAKRGVNPLLHYLLSGWREGRAPHPLFDTDWYLKRYPDVAAAGVNPLLHYVMYGASERRACHPLFDPHWYLEQYPDVAQAGMEPLTHYIMYGAYEGRTPHPKLSKSTFEEAFPDSSKRRTNPLIQLLTEEAADLTVQRSARSSSASRPGATASAENHVINQVQDYCLPDRLTEYIIARFSDTAVAAVRDLMSIVEKFGNQQSVFENSLDLEALVTRARTGAAKQARKDTRASVTVSIIIPVHNALLFTLTCIVALLESATLYTYEILIADDASTDRTTETIPVIGGCVRHIRQAQNLGFLQNCNAAAARAQGRFLVFLNNDTMVLPNWLDALVCTFDTFNNVGLVGSKLLNGDGTLQEAGGVLWQDGSAWNFGRNKNARLPEFNYVKDVDYCSGASIAVPRQLWDRLSGFDAHFAPAYYEDTDLALRIRELGYRTLYQPFSEVIHHEGRSHGRDLASGIKAYQLANQQKLFERWRNTLKSENFLHAQNVFFARDRSRCKTHLLLVDHYVPEWDRDAGSRSIFHIIKMLITSNFHVTFWPDNLNETPVYAKCLQQLGVEVIYGSEYVNDFEDWMTKYGQYFRYALVSRPHVSIKYIDTIRRRSSAKLLYYGHDLHWLRLKREYEISNQSSLLSNIDACRQLESRIFSLCDTLIYPSAEECDAVRAETNFRKSVIEIPVWCFEEAEIDAVLQTIDDGYTSRNPQRLLFVGSFAHGPNVDGVLWFAKEVFPRLQSRIDKFHLTIAGSGPPQSVLALRSEDINVTGFISDERLAELYSIAGASVVPLRYGAGVKGKVIEAFAKGIPVVSTSVGMQGIANSSKLAFLANDPVKFAREIMRAAKDRALALRKVKVALRYVRDQYSVTALRNRMAPEVPELTL